MNTASTCISAVRAKSTDDRRCTCNDLFYTAGSAENMIGVYPSKKKKINKSASKENK